MKKVAGRQDFSGVRALGGGGGWSTGGSFKIR